MRLRDSPWPPPPCSGVRGMRRSGEPRPLPPRSWKRRSVAVEPLAAGSAPRCRAGNRPRMGLGTGRGWSWEPAEDEVGTGRGWGWDAVRLRRRCPAREGAAGPGDAALRSGGEMAAGAGLDERRAGRARPAQPFGDPLGSAAGPRPAAPGAGRRCAVQGSGCRVSACLRGAAGSCASPLQPLLQGKSRQLPRHLSECFGALSSRGCARPPSHQEQAGGNESWERCGGRRSCWQAEAGQR